MARIIMAKVEVIGPSNLLESTPRTSVEFHYAKTFSLEHAETLLEAYAPKIVGTFTSANTALSSHTEATIANEMAMENLKVEARVVGRRAKASRRISGD